MSEVSTLLIEAFNDGYKQGLAASRLAEPEAVWYDVSKGDLPGAKGYVLANRLGKVIISFYDVEDKTFYDHQITHWMPLPAPPKP